MARKILCIIPHLLVTGEEYVGKDSVKLPRLRSKVLARIPLEEMVEVSKGARYVVRLHLNDEKLHIATSV